MSRAMQEQQGHQLRSLRHNKLVECKAVVNEMSEKLTGLSATVQSAAHLRQKAPGHRSHHANY